MSHVMKMSGRTRFVAATVLLGALAAPALAGSFDPGRVDAEASWIAHLDVERLLESTVGSFVLEHADEFDIDLGDLDELEEELGFDLRTDLESITAYGMDDFGDEGVIVAVTSSAVDDALDRLADHPDVELRAIEVGGRNVIVIGDEDEQHYVHVRSDPRRSRRIVVLADDLETMERALDVVDGHRPGLSMGKKQMLARGPAEGSILYLAARDIESFDEFEPASEIVRLSDSVIVDLGENDEALFGRATVAAGSEEDANDIAMIVGGMIALGRLVARDDPDLAPLAGLVSAVRVNTDGKEITIRFRLATEHLTKVLEAMTH